MNKSATYKRQKNLSFFQFITEVINLVVVVVSVVLSGSLIMWTDLLNSFGNTLRTGMMSLFSRKMSNDVREEYNYGIGKLEAMISIFCDICVFVGLIVTLGFSVYEIINPKVQTEMLVVAVGFKAICVLFDTPILIGQYRIRKADKNRVTNSGFMATLGAFLFDCGALVAVLVVWLMRTQKVSSYLSPIFAITIAIVLFVFCLKRILASTIELTDRALSKSEQAKILGVINNYSEKYDMLYEIKTRNNGENVCIDVCVAFNDDCPYKDIKELRDILQEELSKIIENCQVSILVAQQSTDIF